MFDWSAVSELGAYLGLEADSEKLSGQPGSQRYLELLRSSTAGVFNKKYARDNADLIIDTVFSTDFILLGNGRKDRILELSEDVFRRLPDGFRLQEAFAEFDKAFRVFVHSFMAAFRGVTCILGIKKEKISLESPGAREYISELKELKCRKPGMLNFENMAHDRAALSRSIEGLLIKYEGSALSNESCDGVRGIMVKVSGYPGYFKTLDSRQKLVETRPIILAFSELQLYPVKETAKNDLLSALSLMLFNAYPTPKLLKFLTKFEPSPENDKLSYEYYAVLALNYFLNGNPDKAAAYNEKALGYARDEEKRAYTYILKSCIHLNGGNFSDAVNALYNCSTLTRDSRMRATALFYLGVIYYEIGNVTEALDCFRQAATGIEDEIDLMGVCNNIGICHMVRGDVKRAARAFEHVEDISRYMGSNTAKLMRSIACGSLGILWISSSDYDRALGYFKEALKLHKDLHDRKSVADQLGNIGLAQKLKQDFNSSLEYFKSCLVLSFECGYLEGVLFSFGQIEQLMALEGRYEDAEVFKQDMIRRNPGIAKMLKKG